MPLYQREVRGIYGSSHHWNWQDMREKPKRFLLTQDQSPLKDPDIVKKHSFENQRIFHNALAGRSNPTA